MDRRKVTVGQYPSQARTRVWLKAVKGQPVAHFHDMVGQIRCHLGTPQDQQDWLEPDAWIDHRLSGGARELARVIWQGSNGAVNPRHVRGIWQVVKNYDLITSGALFDLSPAGRDFVANPLGDTVRQIDDGEGLLFILGLVAERGPGQRRDLLPSWQEFLAQVSGFSADSVARHTLGLRLSDLCSRGLTNRIGHSYSISDHGLSYLGLGSATDLAAIRELADRSRRTVMTELQQTLASMPPYALEVLVKRLLEAMGYDDVEVTPATGDGGVDVTASIQLGITAVREVVQVKRKRASVQRKDLDALRGCLHRFQAVRGTLITTGQFARGTRDAAFEPGAAPITLIDGERLVQLLVEHGIGVRRKSIELLELVAADLVGEPDEELVDDS